MNEVKEIMIEKIKVGEHEQRLDAEDTGIDELAASIRRIGLISPLWVVADGDLYLLIAGHRRLLAAKLCGLNTVPCLVRASKTEEDSELSFAENFFRKDLSPVELASAIKDCWMNKRMGIKELAAGFNKSVHWVNLMLAITDWPADILEAIHEGKLSVSAASNLALVTDDSYRDFLVRNAVESGVTARTTASWLQAWRAMQPAEEAITAEPDGSRPAVAPMVPQAPCLCCGQTFKVNEMSHVPVCGACVQIIRQVGMSQG